MYGHTEPQAGVMLTVFVDENTTGYYVQPTIILTKDPKFVTMVEEIFGPVLTIYVYKASEYESMVRCHYESKGHVGLTYPHSLTWLINRPHMP